MDEFDEDIEVPEDVRNLVREIVEKTERKLLEKEVRAVPSPEVDQTNNPESVNPAKDDNVTEEEIQGWLKREFPGDIDLEDENLLMPYCNALEPLGKFV